MRTNGRLFMFVAFFLTSTVAPAGSNRVSAAINMVLNMVEVSVEVGKFVKDFVDESGSESQHYFDGISQSISMFETVQEDVAQLTEIIIQIHFDREIQVPQQIVSEAIYDYVTHHNSHYFHYLNQSCSMYRPKDLLFRLHSIVVDNELLFLQAVRRSLHSSTLTRALYQDLSETLQMIAFNYGFCNHINGVPAAESMASVQKVVSQIGQSLLTQLDQIHSEYFASSVESFVKNNVAIDANCKPDSTCNHYMAASIESALKNQFNYGDVFYVRVTKKRCEIWKSSPHAVLMKLQDRNVIIHRSRPGPVSLELKDEIPQRLAQNMKQRVFQGNDFCRHEFAKEVDLRNAGTILAPHLKEFDFTAACEQDPFQTTVPAAHVQTRTFPVCNYWFSYNRAVTLLYGTDLRNAGHDNLELVRYVQNNTQLLLLIQNKVKQAKFELSQLPSTTTRPQTTTRSVQDTIRLFAGKVAYLMGKRIDASFLKFKNSGGAAVKTEEITVQPELEAMPLAENDTIPGIAAAWRAPESAASSSSQITVHPLLLAFVISLIASYPS